MSKLGFEEASKSIFPIFLRKAMEIFSRLVISQTISSNSSEKILINTSGKTVSKMKRYDLFTLSNTAGLSESLEYLFHLHISSFCKYMLSFYFLKNKWQQGLTV